MLIFKSSAADYAVIDVETTDITPGETPQTLFWGYADSKGYKRFETSKQLARFLQKQSPKVLLHHSNFDVIQLLVDGITDLQILRSHKTRLIRCSYGQHILQNTLTVFPVSLEQIFKAFGYKKSSLKQLAKRNYEDCVNGLDCFLKMNQLFHELVGVYPLSVGTVAGTTFKAAENVAGKMPKDLRFLDAYRGGRVEVFDLRKVKASMFDIHSSYPASFFDAPLKDELWLVRVKTKDWHCPFFDRSVDDMLLFPNGTFSSYVFKSNFERYIAPYAEKTSVKVIARHPIRFDWIVELQGLIQTLYNTKANADSEGLKLVCKFLLNAFYGRIGLKGETERARILDEIPDGDITYFSLPGKRWLVFDSVERDTKSNYPFAAFITDNARCRLYQAFKRNHPYYGDTDSIFTRATKNEFVESVSEKCGDWGYNGRKYFQARNVKDYEWNGEEVVKGGIPGKAKNIWTLKQFLRKKVVDSITRTRQSGLRKRIVLSNGETVPLTVNK